MNDTAQTRSARPEPLLAWMEGLADPTRLRLLRVLERRELGVVELCEVLRLPQSTVSRHLKVLSDQGWLENRRQGTASLYRMGSALPGVARRLWRLAHEQIEGWPTLREDERRLEARLRARRERTERFFSRAAAEWDRMRAELYGNAFFREALLALLPPGASVADLGCGTGELTAALARYAGRVVAVDQSAAMLRATRRRVEGCTNVELHRSELESLPVPEAACDAAFLLLVLSYVADPAAVLSEAARILRPGGRLVLVDLSRHDDERFRERMGQAHAGFEPDLLASLLTRSGLRDPELHPLPPEPGARGPVLLLGRAVKPELDLPLPQPPRRSA